MAGRAGLDLLAGGAAGCDDAKVALQVQDVQQPSAVARCKRGIHQRAHAAAIGRVPAFPWGDWLFGTTRAQTQRGEL